ncbi:hypothetical protein SCD_n01607 [Sulfuricella denitrificans skB26]|uniref:Uncharacterized protein n=1 Tax=Sulfuricella denitrificans (strain DSM 22764 / NBRC 105220 / skB26) TaxID=1163617 RepID=S6ACB2_SULDS|nr:hypothetical protein SCD_n01607 [Sulfuricella denitrificans skB26]
MGYTNEIAVTKMLPDEFIWNTRSGDGAAKTINAFSQKSQSIYLITLKSSEKSMALKMQYSGNDACLTR